MPSPKKTNKFKCYKITYFEGDYFSSAGEDMKTIHVAGRSEAEAEEIFKSMFKGCHASLIEEVKQ